MVGFNLLNVFLSTYLLDTIKPSSPCSVCVCVYGCGNQLQVVNKTAYKKLSQCNPFSINTILIANMSCNNKEQLILLPLILLYNLV